MGTSQRHKPSGQAMRRELLNSLRSIFRRRSHDAAAALTVVRHVDAQVPPLDLSLALSEDDDQQLPLSVPPPLQRGTASRNVLSESSRPRVRARRNAVIHVPFDGIAFFPDEAGSDRSTSISEELSDLLPSRKLSARSAAALSENVCAICCDDMKADDSVACMPCAGLHAYHHGCVRQWLGHGNPQCPTCRWTVDEDMRQSLQNIIARAEAHLDQLQRPMQREC